MWESENESRGRERMSSLDIERHDGLKNDAFVRRDQSWYTLYKYYNHIVSSCSNLSTVIYMSLVSGSYVM